MDDNPFVGVPPDILETEDVAMRLHMEARTVRKLVNEGVIPGRKLGGSWRFFWPLVVMQLFGQQEEDTSDDAPGGAGDRERPPRGQASA